LLEGETQSFYSEIDFSKEGLFGKGGPDRFKDALILLKKNETDKDDK
jgi:hypothetical protein